jgi:hypothetical protein
VPASTSVPKAAHAIPLPITAPVKPKKVVIQIGIGSGPGTAQRASPPITNAATSVWMIAPMFIEGS